MFGIYHYRYVAPVCGASRTDSNIKQEGADYIWGHEREIHSGQPGDVYRSWYKELGLAYRVKAAFSVRQ